MFRGVGPYFPGTAAGQGTNNKNIRDTSLAANNNTTTCGFATTTTVRDILAKPLTSNTTSATPAYGQDFGWNILTADMDNPDGTTNKRVLPAGNYVFTVCLTASTPDTGANFGVQVRMHKRADSAATFTNIAFASSANAAIVTSINVTITVNVATEVVFETNETLHVEYWVHGRGGGTTGLIAQTIILNVGTTTLFSENTIDMPSPGLFTRFYETLSATMVGVATKGALLLKKTRSATMVGAATFARDLTLLRSRSVTMIGVASMTRLLTLHRTFSATMVGVATFARDLALHRTFSATMVGVSTFSRLLTLRRSLSVTMIGVATMSRLLALHRTFSRVMVGVATFSRRIIFARTFSATMTGVASGRIEVPFENLPSGGSVIVRGYPRSRVVNK